MADKPRSAQEIMKAADKDDDGRYALSEEDIAEMIAGVVMRMRKPDANETDEAESADEPRSGSMAQDRARFSPRTAAYHAQFPNAWRLTEKRPPVFDSAGREVMFPNATRLGR